ncbi:MAG: VWA domain-containing protein, partial [Campylobacter hominis]|uniref:VWA domain-containing protein n=1 Tax=Campylobacter hominis TaxID=76517 RepID=UPI0023F412BB
MVSNLNLNGDFSAEVLSYYIWGQKTAPSPSEIASSKFIDRKDKITLNIDTNEFISKTGEIVNTKDFKLFEVFFSGKTKDGNNIDLSDYAMINGEYSLTQEQFADIFYGIKDDNYISAKNPATSISLYNRNINNPNFAKLAFVFGSMEVGLDTKNIRYILDSNGNPLRVENIAYNFNDDNFDFNGGSGSELVNQILKQIADPSGIGKAVNLKFNGLTDVGGGTITKDDYNNTKSLIATDLEWSDFIGGIYGISSALLKKYGNYILFLNEFNHIKSTGVIDYLDKNGKVVIFGSNNNDTINGTIAKNFDLNGSVDINNLPDFLATKLLNLNHYKNHINNGITYIGGKGSDTITGTKFDDILYSNDNTGVDDNSPDTLKGGSGYDTYYAGDKDIIYDDKEGDGEVYFNGIKLNGGAYDNNLKAYVDIDNSFIHYTLSGKSDNETLKVTNINTNETLIINNYNKNLHNQTGKSYLDINLTEDLGKEVAIVIDTTGSMSDDIDAAKESAKAIAQNIFRSNLNNNEPNNKNSEVYSKISIVTFSDNNIKTLGSYNNYNSFQKGINQVYEQGGGTEYHCAAMLEGMSNFTKDNGLNKEIYLMTDESGDDNHRMDEVIYKAKNFGSLISFKSAFSNKSKFDNSVKINIISINHNQSHLKKLSDETGGMYLQPNSIEELKDALFDISNQGTNKNETIIGNDKDNILNGKGGSDILKGLKGNDTYVFEGSFNHDIIIDEIGENKIVFKDRSVNDIDFVKVKNDLFLVDYKTKGGPTNYVKVINFFNNDKAYKNKTPNITSIKFKDYTINEETLTFMSNSSSNTYNFLNDTSNNFYINKGKGKFIVGHKNKENLITTNNYDDVVIGGDKNDIIKTNSGNDVIIGNKGDDILISKFGNDTYIFNLGDGNDTIIDNKGKDTIKFNGDIKNLNFTKIADDL